MTTLFYDSETFSEEPIENGLDRYAAKAEIMVVTWAVGEDIPDVWDATRDPRPPQALLDALAHSDKIVAHSAPFDRGVMLRSSIPEFQTAAADIQRWHCSMVRAYQHGLPGGLDKLCQIYNLPQSEAKHKEGRSLILRFCKPQPATFKLRRCTRETHPKEWARFIEYALSDITAMRAIYKQLPSWNMTPTERELWLLDQATNARGFQVDMDLVHAAVRAVDKAKADLKARTAEATEGVLESTTQRDKTLDYVLAEYGVSLPDMKSDTLERRIADPELPEGLRELLRIRLQASNASTAKFKKLVKCVSGDGRLRWTIQFAGAGRTGRDAGRLYQPHNAPRLTLPPDVIETGIAALKLDAADMVFDNVMELASNTIRSAMVAPPSKKLVVADLSNIEGRTTVWLAGETQEIQAFRAFDAGTGPDLYKLTYARAFNIRHEVVTKPQRQIGKMMSLASSFGGGVAALVTGAATYGIDLGQMTEAVIPVLPADVLDEARGFLEWTRKERRSTFGLPDDVFVACDSLKRLWRREHAKVEAFWKDLEEGARLAVANPGQVFPVGAHLAFERRKNWLLMRLPSGRHLCYPGIHVTEKGEISYMGVSPYTKQWVRLKTWGGKLTENCASGTARDVLFYATPAIENAGYQILMKIHDSVVTETPDTDEFNAEGLCEMLCAEKPWHVGLPLTAKGFEGVRYAEGD